MRLKPGLKKISNLIFSLLLIGFLLLALLPFFRWYLGRQFFPGSDLYNTGSYLVKLSKDPQFPARKWLYHWFAGSCLAFDYQNLHLYSLLPLVKAFGPIQAQNYYALASLFLFGIFSYLFLRQLAKDKIMAGLLAAAIIFSASLYPSLIVIGSLSYFASQFFLPLILFLLEKERQTKKKKYLYLAGLATGLGLYGHPTLVLILIIPFSLMLVIASPAKNRFKKAGLYLLASILIGWAGCFHYLRTSLAKLLPFSGPPGLFGFSDWPNKELFWQDLFGTHFLLISAILVFFVLNLTIKKQKKRVFPRLAPYFLALIYLGLYNLLLYLKLNPFSGIMNWPRSLWPLPLILASLAAIGWQGLKPKLSSLTKPAVYFLFLLLLVLSQESSLEAIKKRAGGGYAYPGIVNQNLDSQKLAGLKKELVPAWLEADSCQERLYSADDRFNMWWSSFYDLPLVRGYFPGLSTLQREAFLNQMDISLVNNLMIEKLKVSQDRAANAAQFYLDWYAIRYLASTSRFWPSTYLEKETRTERKELKFGVDYLEFNQALYSPILAPTNAPTLCFLGSDQAYNYFIRGLARFNLNSQVLIPIRGPKTIQALQKDWLAACDALVIYDLGKKALWPSGGKWKILTEAIGSGKSIFIETGENESFGAESESLPEFFPIQISQMISPGKDWQLSSQQDHLLDEIDLSLFSPPVWENLAWKFSLSQPEKVKSWAQPILKNHDQPILVTGRYNQARVIWSGLNLPFHLDYYDNDQEAKLFLNIIKEILPIGAENQSEISFEVNWISPEKREITTGQAKGIIFKERLDPGWKAKTEEKIKLALYPAGPSDPGFGYLRLPPEHSGQITLSYSGPPLAWLYFSLSFLTLLIIGDEILFKGRLFSQKILGKLGHFFQKRIKFTREWWNKEE